MKNTHQKQSSNNSRIKISVLEQRHTNNPFLTSISPEICIFMVINNRHPNCDFIHKSAVFLPISESTDIEIAISKW